MTSRNGLGPPNAPAGAGPLSLAGQPQAENQVGLQLLLESRDIRAQFQRTLTQSYRLPLVCLTVNMPGPVKRDERSEFIFLEGVSAIRERLAGHIMYVKLKDLPTGFEGFFVTEMAADRLKAAMVDIEETHGLGRLMDIDVLDADMAHISRRGLGFPPRRCLICGGDAAACGRSRAHSFDRLHQRIDKIIEEYRNATGQS